MKHDCFDEDFQCNCIPEKAQKCSKSIKRAQIFDRFMQYSLIFDAFVGMRMHRI